MRITKLRPSMLACLLMLWCLLVDSTAHAQTWRPVRGGIQYGISGMALIEHSAQGSAFLVVHDNKKAGEERIAVVVVKVAPEEPSQYVPLEWPTNELPYDLEALSAIAGIPGAFIAMSSKGALYWLSLNALHTRVVECKRFTLPKASQGSELEGFSLQRIGERMLAVWADRGDGEQPAVLYWAWFNPKTLTFSQVRSRPFRVPWPSSHTRHISALKIDSTGALLVTSTSDPGNHGPFDSALYLAGVFGVMKGKADFLPGASLVRLYRLGHHKVEAFELAPGPYGGLVFATDDEHFGSSMYLDW